MIDINTCFLDSKLYKLNKKKIIYKIFNIPEYARLTNFNYDDAYSFFYLMKQSKNNIDPVTNKRIKTSKEERFNSYLEISDEMVPLIKQRPIDFCIENYRLIINVKKEFDWVKKAQAKFHKIMIKSIPNLSYLHSTVKHKSYATNAKTHIGNRYVLAIDLKNFFTCVSRERVGLTLKKILNIDKDVAMLYSKLLTSPIDEPPMNCNKHNLGQGLPSSPLLAFICNFWLFEYINDLAKEMGIIMSIYVDDITFSSDKEIPQKFINKLFRLFKNNGMKINKKKFRNYKNLSAKKTTGGFISHGKLKIPSRKHEEIFVLYNKIINDVKKIRNVDDYIYLANLFSKFRGLCNYLVEFECKGSDNKVSIPLNYNKYKELIEKLGPYFPNNYKKLNKSKPLSEENISKDDFKKLLLNFEKFKNCYTMILNEC